MSIPENDGIVYLTATGGEVTLPFDFKIYDKAYLLVTRYVGAVPTIFVLDTNYTIADNQVGVDGGGVIGLTVAAVAGEIYILQSNVPYQRATNFFQAGDFFAAAVNRELDLITQQIQQIRRDGGRSIALDPIINLSSSSVREAPVDGSTLMWDGTTGDIINGPSGVDILNAGPNAAIAAQAAIDAVNANAAAQSAAAGMKWRPSVKAATTAALPSCTYANGASGVGATLTATANGAFPSQDGVASALNNDYLIKDQAAGLQNGVYRLTQLGTGATPWILTRRTDADTWTELVSQVVAPEEGTTQADIPYICTVNSGGTIGVTSITWTILPVPIQDNAVTTNKIANLAVTYGKIATAAFASVADLAAGTASVILNAATFKTYNDNIKNSWVRLDTANGAGSTNGAIRRFVNSLLGSYTTDITYADSATLGASLTINTTGTYAINYSDNSSSSSVYFGISKNGNSLNASIFAQTPALRLGYAHQVNNAFPVTLGIVVPLVAGDVIRPHLDLSSANGTAAFATFLIQRIS